MSENARANTGSSLRDGLVFWGAVAAKELGQVLREG